MHHAERLEAAKEYLLQKGVFRKILPLLCKNLGEQDIKFLKVGSNVLDRISIHGEYQSQLTYEQCPPNYEEQLNRPHPSEYLFKSWYAKAMQKYEDRRKQLAAEWLASKPPAARYTIVVRGNVPYLTLGEPVPTKNILEHFSEAAGPGQWREAPDGYHSYNFTRLGLEVPECPPHSHICPKLLVVDYDMELFVAHVLSQHGITVVRLGPGFEEYLKNRTESYAKLLEV